jgi:hypothetical protein
MAQQFWTSVAGAERRPTFAQMKKQQNTADNPAAGYPAKR